MFEMMSNKCSLMIGQSFGLIAQTVSKTDESVFTGVAMLGLLTLTLIVAIVAGRMIANSLRMAEYGTRLSLIIGCILISVLLISTKWPPKFGVDLTGGMNLIGELNLDKMDETNTTTAKDIIGILIRRVDPSGTKEIMIRPLGTDKIEVTIPTNNEVVADEIWKSLAKTGLLQFRIVADRMHTGHAECIRIAEQMMKTGDNSTVVKDGIGNEVGRWIRLARIDPSERKKDNPLDIKFIPQPGHILRDSATGAKVLVESIDFGNKAKFHKLNFARWWDDNQVGSPQVLVMVPDEEMNVEGKHLTSIQAGIDETGNNQVSFDANAEGAQRMGAFTTTHKPEGGENGKYFLMGIVLDGQLHSAPRINEPIWGRGRITGDFSQNEIKELVTNLRSGKLDVALNKNPISRQFIASKLGEELKQKSVYAIGISFVLVIIFMVIYYRFSGIVATFALLMNVVMIMAFLMSISYPISLTGLAGIVLTVGMSVDANVLIFERIREEIDRGAALRMAIRNGFDKATVTIVDANVTTFITAVVLYVIGTEQIKGFAVTLAIGIILSMVTAVYFSRAIFEIAERKRFLTKLGMARILGKTEINFIGRRMIAATFSVLMIGTGVAAMFLLGQKILDHDLRGGSTVRMVLNESSTPDDVRTALNNATVDPINGEEIEFDVSALTDNTYPNRVYKVDANIPTFEGGENKYDSLAEILERVFQGKLSLHTVEVKLISGGSEENSGAEKSNATPKSETEQEVGMNLPSLPSILSALTLSNPSVLLQDPGEQDSTKVDSGTQDPETTEAETEQADDPAATQDAPEAGGEFGAANAAQDNEVVLGVISTVINLEFEHRMSGRAIRTLISEYAKENANLELDEAQIEVMPVKVVVDEDNRPESMLDKEWDITIKSSNAALVENAVRSWASSFATRPYFPTVSGVGGQIASETQWQAMAAIIASLLGIIAYVWIRFQNVAFGLAAVVALIHDVMVVLGCIAISHFFNGSLEFMKIESFKISLPVVAALLTIIGYSLNDTIVVFDRIREVRGKRSEITQEIVNSSICQTLSRTILTSITTFLVVFILFCFGGDAIHGFAFALVVGVIVGTYSSIFVASPVLLWLMNRVGLNPGLPEEANDKKAVGAA